MNEEDQVVKDAIEAIQAVFGDTSVPIEETRERLEYLIEVCRDNIVTL